MKLRKALDKARKTRQQTKVINIRRQPAVKSPDNDWRPPVYDESVHAMADPDLVRDNRYVCIDQKTPEIEFYKVLRTRIQQATRVSGHNAVMITSPLAGEGKTTTAINLSMTFAKAYNQTVLLIDGDLRRQHIHSRLGIDSKRGLVDFLVGEAPLKDYILWPGIQKMTLISGGSTIQNSAELLGSKRMKALVKEMKNRYSDRYVIFDTPPVLQGADALTLAPLMDAIVLVVQEGKTGMRNIKKALSMLPHEKLLGVVINQQKIAAAEYYDEKR
jgi:non-specific protein-tyrosine kinase